MKWTDGFWKKNPLLRLALGLCPALAVTTTATGGLAMGLCACCVLVATNLVMALLRGLLSEKAWLPVTLVVAACFATVAEMLLKAYFPAASDALGVFVPLLSVSCLILCRVEASAKPHGIGAALADGVCMGLGYALATLALGCIRELLGHGSLFGHELTAAANAPFLLASLPAGGFLILGLLMGLCADRSGGKEGAKHE